MNKLSFQPQIDAKYKNDYVKIVEELNGFALKSQLKELWLRIRELCLEDLFFLLYFVLGLKHVNHPWVVDRVREVEELHDDTLDLWSREHWKSSILTYGLVIQEILRNPEERVAIFSHNRGIAKAFLRRIKHTFEQNDLLKTVFADILYTKPDSQSPKWSEDDGIIVKRKGVYNEASVEAWGLIDGMPTSKHFTIRVYDDVVTRESVTTPEQIKKVDESFKLSQFLGARGGQSRVIGTRYHFADQYSKMKKSGAYTVRERLGVVDGKPVLLTHEELEKFKRIVCEGNTYIYNCQMLLDPVAEENQTFKRYWLRYYRVLPQGAMNLYLLVDPAHTKKEKGLGSDYTVMWVWGLDALGNYFLVDLIRDRLNLTERWKTLKGVMKKHPTTRKVGYEHYGMQADIEHHQHMMLEDGIYFNIEPLGGRLAKEDRIRRLIPLFENGKVYLPEALYRNGRDLIREFIEEEYLLFPFAPHDDCLDCGARILDETFEAYPPMAFPQEDDYVDGYEKKGVVSLGWYKAKKESRFANV